MRNLFQKNLGFVNCPLVCIQPTYEELKRLPFTTLITLRFGIQPTYEELKLSELKLKKHTEAGIQPTYEELKPRLP